MSEFKGIPIVPPAAHARSGEKYTTPQGFTAIKDGVKHSHGGSASLRKPAWLRVPLGAGADFSAVKNIGPLSILWRKEDTFVQSRCLTGLSTQSTRG